MLRLALTLLAASTAANRISISYCRADNTNPRVESDCKRDVPWPCTDVCIAAGENTARACHDAGESECNKKCDERCPPDGSKGTFNGNGRIYIGACDPAKPTTIQRDCNNAHVGFCTATCVGAAQATLSTCHNGVEDECNKKCDAICPPQSRANATQSGVIATFAPTTVEA